jgi:hypothetical protein
MPLGGRQVVGGGPLLVERVLLCTRLARMDGCCVVLWVALYVIYYYEQKSPSSVCSINFFGLVNVSTTSICVPEFCYILCPNQNHSSSRARLTQSHIITCEHGQRIHAHNASSCMSFMEGRGRAAASPWLRVVVMGAPDKGRGGQYSRRCHS